ncbi:hypothetical protein NDN01_02280 [Sphingomonas sp. QA11]|uniref:hypothetical protein n=1 Tax=Sphingomonas sp. QA11 TaxID=2950605 RepID=UPI00234A069B|nr:hypothetical protein [Sphingomonas sp. QA11]WCM27779.1 hypothetical protein NDN01_02280 [Sphingomonas sp. QA11]
MARIAANAVIQNYEAIIQAVSECRGAPIQIAPSPSQHDLHRSPSVLLFLIFATLVSLFRQGFSLLSDNREFNIKALNIFDNIDE